MGKFSYFLFFVLNIICEAAENKGSNKLGDVIKNHTMSGYNTTRNQSSEDNIMKQEAWKFLSECGFSGDDDDNYDYDDRHNNRNKPQRDGNFNRGDSRPVYKSNSNNNEYGNTYGNNNHDRGNRNEGMNGRRFQSSNNRYERSRGNQGGGNRYYGHNNDYNDNSNEEENSSRRSYSNNRGNNNRNGNHYDNNSDDSYDSRNGNRRMNRTKYFGDYSNDDCHERNNDYDNSRSTNYNGNANRNRNYGNSNTNRNPYWHGSGDYGNTRGNGYGYTGREPIGSFDRNSETTALRAKRSNEDSQCASQCVFGYLEVLDDNRSPSETLVIKWLQDHIGNEMKRMRAFREARRCFARMSTSDNEDGCEFSKKIAKCLNLEFE